MKRFAMQAVAIGQAIPLQMRYPGLYILFVLLAALDLAFTWTILRIGGTEINPVAEGVVEHGGLPGIVIFKTALVLLIIVMCEVIGQRRRHVGRRLASVCVAVTAVPVMSACAQLTAGQIEDMPSGREPPRRILELPSGYAATSTGQAKSKADPANRKRTSANLVAASAQGHSARVAAKDEKQGHGIQLVEWGAVRRHKVDYSDIPPASR